MSVTVAPHGIWKSPITGDSFTARFVTLSQVRVDGPDTYWVEGHPLQGGRGTLLRRRSTGETGEVLPLIDGTRLPDVGTRVHEYGGKAYAVHHGLIVFSDRTDGRVYAFDTSDARRGVRPLTPLSKVRYGDFWIADVRDLVYAVAEDHSGEGEPVNSIVAIPLDGSAARDNDAIIPVFGGTDFAQAPTVSPDGTKLAWLSWNHPNMPWTYSQLHVASLTFEGRIDQEIVLVDQPGVCVYEPRWTLDGELIHVDDSSGWANLYRTQGFTWNEGEDPNAWTSRLRTRALHPGKRAFSHPHWHLGLHSYDNFDNDYLVCSWSEDQVWHIGTVRIDNGLTEEWATGWWPIGNVAAADGRVVFLAEVPTALVSTAEMITWKTQDGEEAHGFYYAPVNPDCEAPEGELPPLIVNVHGGPTEAARPGLQVPFQYWTSRGFAVLDVNFRGSTSFGRAYRERLNGNWGVMDVQDCIDGARYLIDLGRVDPARVAIRGRSSGGFTVLNALASSDVFTAGASFSGIADLVKLAETSHKFESHYDAILLGTDDPSDPVWAQRSPVNRVADIKAPLMLLQGTDDPVVPVEQAKEMYEALRAAGNAVALKLYEGEGHGFRSAQNIKDALLSELSFYRTVWGIATDTPIHVEIANL